jgi:hypothetical protein
MKKTSRFKPGVNHEQIVLHMIYEASHLPIGTQLRMGRYAGEAEKFLQDSQEKAGLKQRKYPK